jgi:hypothetical protein
MPVQPAGSGLVSHVSGGHLKGVPRQHPLPGAAVKKKKKSAAQYTINDELRVVLVDRGEIVFQ